MKKKYTILQLGAAFALAAILSAGIVTITTTPTEVVETEFVTVTKEVPVEVEVMKYIFLPQELGFSHMEDYGDYIAVYYSYMGEMHRHDYYGDVENMQAEEYVSSDETSFDVTNNIFTLTAYCGCEECCGIYADGMTATMTVATQGRTVAVDPSIIPYGTHLLIDGHEYVAEDCGKFSGNHIDVFFTDHEEAKNFGRRTAEVTILD